MKLTDEIYENSIVHRVNIEVFSDLDGSLSFKDYLLIMTTVTFKIFPSLTCLKARSFGLDTRIFSGNFPRRTFSPIIAEASKASRQ